MNECFLFCHEDGGHYIEFWEWKAVLHEDQLEIYELFKLRYEVISRHYFMEDSELRN